MAQVALLNELLQPEGTTTEGIQLWPGTSHLLWVDADALVANPRLRIEETICGAPPSVQLVIGYEHTCVFPLLLRLPVVLRSCVCVWYLCACVCLLLCLPVCLLLPLPLTLVRLSRALSRMVSIYMQLSVLHRRGLLGELFAQHWCNAGQAV